MPLGASFGRIATILDTHMVAVDNGGMKEITLKSLALGFLLAATFMFSSCGGEAPEDKPTAEEAAAQEAAAKEAAAQEAAAKEAALDEPVLFKCPNLEAVILEALKKPKGPITRGEIALLETLEATKREITNLSGIEYASNLGELKLRYNQITDLSPLAAATNLTVLNVADNKFKDVTPLTALTNLQSLTVSFNKLNAKQEAVLQKALPNCEILF